MLSEELSETRRLEERAVLRFHQGEALMRPMKLARYEQFIVMFVIVLQGPVSGSPPCASRRF